MIRVVWYVDASIGIFSINIKNQFQEITCLLNDLPTKGVIIAGGYVSYLFGVTTNYTDIDIFVFVQDLNETMIVNYIKSCSFSAPECTYNYGNDGPFMCVYSSSRQFDNKITQIILTNMYSTSDTLFLYFNFDTHYCKKALPSFYGLKIDIR